MKGLRLLRDSDTKAVLMTIPFTILIFVIATSVLTLDNVNLIGLYSSYFDLAILFVSSLVARQLVSLITVGELQPIYYHWIIESTISFFATLLIIGLLGWL